MIESLSTLTPDPSRAAKVRAKCRGRLEARRQRQLDRGPGIIERALVGGFALIYVVALAGQVMRIFPPF